MRNNFRAAPACAPAPAATGRTVPHAVHLESALAPVTFCWHAYTASGRASKYNHFVTLERLQLVSEAPSSGVSRLAPSGHFQTTADEMKAWLQQRARAILPHLPMGYIWIGPELVHETTTAAAASTLGTAIAASGSPAGPLCDVIAIARRVLHAKAAA
jgi:23S rRNA C2498 (ribose-2'-O)-methylase RlmM